MNNTYLLYTRSGKAYLVKATYSHDAEAVVVRHTQDVVSCWFIVDGSFKLPKDAITLN